MYYGLLREPDVAPLPQEEDEEGGDGDKPKKKKKTYWKVEMVLVAVMEGKTFIYPSLQHRPNIQFHPAYGCYQWWRAPKCPRSPSLLFLKKIKV